MKSGLLIAVALLAATLVAPLSRAAEPSEVATELKALTSRVQTKLKENKKTEQDLAEELKGFDALLAKHRGEKTEEVAQVLYMKAMLYLQVLDDTDKGIAAMKELKTDFPDTRFGRNADQVIERIRLQREAKKTQAALVRGAKFPDFGEKDLAGKPLSIANYKGKVVLIDFWATWCGPCVHELPNVLKAYEKHHARGFEIIGISLDSDRQKLTTFLEEKKMPWQQFFDGKGWQNKLATKYGVNSIPATYLLDGEGKILGKDLRGEALEQAVARALARK